MRVRPTQARVRKSLFDVLSGQVSDKLVIDIFAGVGSIGIEALRRGAKKVFFIEKDKKLSSIIRNNLNSFNFKERGDVWPMDAFRALRVLKKKGFLFDMFFADPPYDYRDTTKFLSHLFTSGILAKEAKGVIEHSRHLHLPDSFTPFEMSSMQMHRSKFRTGPSFKKWKEKRFGETVLTFYNGDQN